MYIFFLIDRRIGRPIQVNILLGWVYTPIPLCGGDPPPRIPPYIGGILTCIWG